MTIAAASFFTAISTGGAPASGTPSAALPGFAAAMGTALATPAAGAPVPATGSPALPGAMLPPQAALIDVTAAAMPMQPAGLLDPNGVAPAPSLTTADAPVASPAETVAPAKIAQRLAAATPMEAAPSTGKVTEPAPSPEQHAAVAAPAVVQAPVAPASAPDQASPAIVAPDEAEPQTEQHAAAEPSSPVQLANLVIDAEATTPTVAIPLTASPATLPPPGEPVNDEPVVAARTQPAASPGKPTATAETAREPAPAAAAQTQPSSFAERVDAAQSPTPNAGPAASQPAAVRSAEASASAPLPAASHEPSITARPGQIGREMGVEIARRLGIGGDELTVRLNPVEMGRIEVRLSFDDRGALRAFVAAESPAALDMLRRDSADLGRALADAGVRADAGSFRFDSRSGSGEGGQFWQRQQGGTQQRGSGHALLSAEVDPDPVYRPLRNGGRVDLIA